MDPPSHLFEEVVRRVHLVDHEHQIGAISVFGSILTCNDPFDVDLWTFGPNHIVSNTRCLVDAALQSLELPTDWSVSSLGNPDLAVQTLVATTGRALAGILPTTPAGWSLGAAEACLCRRALEDARKHAIWARASYLSGQGDVLGAVDRALRQLERSTPSDHRRRRSARTRPLTSLAEQFLGSGWGDTVAIKIGRAAGGERV